MLHRCTKRVKHATVVYQALLLGQLGLGVRERTRPQTALSWCVVWRPLEHRFDVGQSSAGTSLTVHRRRLSRSYATQVHQASQTCDCGVPRGYLPADNHGRRALSWVQDAVPMLRRRGKLQLTAEEAEKRREEGRLKPRLEPTLAVGLSLPLRKRDWCARLCILL